jgi:hypothetical protein
LLPGTKQAGIAGMGLYLITVDDKITRNNRY